MEPTTPLPASKAFGDDERSVLLGYLTYHRTVLARKIEGVSDEDARRKASPPSELSLLGLIRHMTDVERWWFRRVHRAEEVAAIFDDDEEWRVPEDATVADALRAYWDEIATSTVSSPTLTSISTPATSATATRASTGRCAGSSST